MMRNQHATFDVQAVTATRRLRERAATDSSLGLEEDTASEHDTAEDCVFVESDDISAAITVTFSPCHNSRKIICTTRAKGIKF